MKLISKIPPGGSNAGWMVLIFLLLGLSITGLPVQAQSGLPLDLEYRIKAVVIKNLALGEILIKEDEVLDSFPLTPAEGVVFKTILWDHLQYPGFGFLPEDPDIEISPVDLSYPKKAWKLYRISISKTAKNDTLASWSNFMRYSPRGRKYFLGYAYSSLAQLTYLKNALVAVKDEKEIRFISWFPYLHATSQDFRLNPKRPESYLPFLRLKLFSHEPDELEFSHEENGLLVFIATDKYRTGVNKRAWFIDPADPDRRIPSKPLTPFPKYDPVDTIGYVNNDVKGKIELTFKDPEDKKRYLLDALMKNIYMHRVLHLENLEERLNLSSSGVLKEGLSVLDSLLPNYDEYLWEISLLQTDCCYKNGKWGCATLNEPRPALKSPILKTLSSIGNQYKVLVGWRNHQGIEFYKFYKTREEYLIRRPSKYTEQAGASGGKWCSWRDTTALAEERKIQLENEERERLNREKMEEWEKDHKKRNREIKKLLRKDKDAAFTPPPPPPPLISDIEPIVSPWTELWDTQADIEWVRYDAFYNAEEKEKGTTKGGDCLFTRPPSQMHRPFYPKKYDYCPPNQAPSPYDAITEPVDFYLLALDPNTREVYFISGKDIYLSKATPLYRAGRSPQEVDESKPWPLEYQLIYLQDRLYQYRVDDLTEEDIVINDEEKIVLEVQGLEDGRPLPLRVTMYKARPEMLEIERL